MSTAESFVMCMLKIVFQLCNRATGVQNELHTILTFVCFFPQPYTMYICPQFLRPQVRGQDASESFTSSCHTQITGIWSCSPFSLSESGALDDSGAKLHKSSTSNSICPETKITINWILLYIQVTTRAEASPRLIWLCTARLLTCHAVIP